MSSLFAQQRNVPYEYPLKPGMPQWKSFKTFRQKLDACQVPNDVLASMSTDALVKTCMSYPLYEVIFMAHEGGQKGFDAVLRGSNGFRELMTRKDAGTSLLSLYRSIDPQGYDPSWEPAKRGQFAATLIRVEVMLSQYSVLSNMSSSERQILLSVAIDKYNKKLLSIHLYAAYGLQNSAFLVGRVLIKQGQSDIPEPGAQAIHISDHVDKGSLLVMDKATLKSIMQSGQRSIDSAK